MDGKVSPASLSKELMNAWTIAPLVASPMRSTLSRATESDVPFQDCRRDDEKRQYATPPQVRVLMLGTRYQERRPTLLL